MIRQSKEQARAQLLSAALMHVQGEQWVKSQPDLAPPPEAATWNEDQLTLAVLNYLPHVTILTAKQSTN